jgi:hypothetical protein
MCFLHEGNISGRKLVDRNDLHLLRGISGPDQPRDGDAIDPQSLTKIAPRP